MAALSAAILKLIAFLIRAHRQRKAHRPPEGHVRQAAHARVRRRRLELARLAYDRARRGETLGPQPC